MKLIKCIIRQHKLDETMDALKGLDISGITVSPVFGRGRDNGVKGVLRGREYDITLVPEFMIDIVAPEHLTDDIVSLIMNTAHTGKHGDGRIFVLPLDEAYTIRTRQGGIA